MTKAFPNSAKTGLKSICERCYINLEKLSDHNITITTEINFQMGIKQ